MGWIIAIGIIVVLAFVYFSMYNGLVKYRNWVDEAWAQIDVQLKRRYDLIPNLVETVKGYAKHEQETLAKVVELRNQLGSKTSRQEQMEVNDQLSGALKNLFALREAYPDLKANQQFRDLQVQLEGTENRIAVARNRYITTVQDFNSYARQFPQVMTAKVIGMDTKPNFSAEQSAQKAPTVSFE